MMGVRKARSLIGGLNDRIFSRKSERDHSASVDTRKNSSAPSIKKLTSRRSIPQGSRVIKHPLGDPELQSFKALLR